MPYGSRPSLFHVAIGFVVVVLIVISVLELRHIGQSRQHDLEGPGTHGLTF